MKAILLAAGYGKRLRPITFNIPKCLVKINNKSLLEIWLDNLSNAGINRFLINTHYLHEKVERFIKKSKYSNNIKISYESTLKGTSGTLIDNLDFIGNESCMLVHADNYCLANLKNFIKHHNSRPENCLITMMTFKTKEPEKCGVVKLDSVGRVIEFYEKVKFPNSNLANGAVYILSKKMINLLKTKFKNTTDFSNDVIPNLMGKIYTFETKDTFLDIGTPQSYNLALKIKG